MTVIPATNIMILLCTILKVNCSHVNFKFINNLIISSPRKYKYDYYNQDWIIPTPDDYRRKICFCIPASSYARFREWVGSGPGLHPFLENSFIYRIITNINLGPYILPQPCKHKYYSDNSPPPLHPPPHNPCAGSAQEIITKASSCNK